VAQEDAFQELEVKLSSIPNLRQLVQGRLSQLHTNWSIVRLGAMLTQHDDDGQEFVLAYVNQSNNKTKVKYNSYMKESAL